MNAHDAAMIAFNVFSKTELFREENEAKFPEAMEILKAAGYTIEDQYDAMEVAEEIEKAEDAAKAPVETGPRVYTQDEMFNILQSAAHRAYHVNARAATDKQIAYLASLIVKADGRDPFSGNTNAVLTAKEASFMIDNYR